MTTLDPSHVNPRRSTLDRDTARALALTEYERLADTLEALTPEQWGLPTCCPGWDVRAMAGHVVGMAEMIATIPELVRQQRASRRGAGPGAGPGALLDAMTAYQVDKNARLSTDALVAACRAVGPRATRGRFRVPRVLLDRVTLTNETGGAVERWTLGYLVETILTRDPWMHRSDISEATGVPMDLTASHDGVIIADVVTEWASRHSHPYDLVLTGPAGGRFTRGVGGEQITSDAEGFFRAVGGRGGQVSGLRAVQVAV